MESCVEALDLEPASADLNRTIAIWINLGVALLYAAQYRDALACMNHVIQPFRE